MPRLKFRPSSLVLLIVGTFLGYELAFFHLKTEKVAGQVILSKKQFEHMLRNMNSETWNQQEVKVYAAAPVGFREGELSEDSVAGSFDEDVRRPTHVPPDIDLYRNSSCGKLTNVSRWFEEKFNENIRPAWSRENLLVTGEAFRWWNSIQPGNETLRQVLEIAQELVAIAGVDESNTNDTCSRCAVVGNSANLASSGYGGFINAHELIFRMNKCPKHGGYAGDVGNRTTHYFAYPESYYEDYLSDASLVFVPFKAVDLLWFRDLLRSPSTGNILTKQFHLYNPQLMWHITRSWSIGRGIYPSTGLLAVFYSLYTCHEVDLFGFGPDREGRWDHYYDKEFKEDNAPFKEPVVHDARAELDLLYKLDSIGRIRIFKGRR